MIVAHTPPARDHQITQFQVFGERRSGTNYLRVLLEANLELTAVHHYGWKHGLLCVPAVSSDTLLVGIARNPLDWLISMNATPFATVERLKDLPFSDFIRAEWEGMARPAGQGWRNAGFRQDLKLRGEVLQFDRHPIEGRPYVNILEMRCVKLRALLGLTQRVTHACVVRYEDARDHPERLLEALTDQFGISRNETLILPDGYVGNKSNPKLIEPADVRTEDRVFIANGLDKDLEARFGYTNNV